MYTKYISDIDRFLINKNYTLNKTLERGSVGFNYYKCEINVLNRIGFIISTKENNIVFWGFTVYINYLLLEEIVTPILSNNNLIGKSLPSDVYNSFYGQNEFEIPIIDELSLNNKEEIDRVNNIFYNFYEESIVPFFAKWDSLNTLYEFIKDKTEVEELESILGIFWQFKKAAILRLCNDKNCQEYIEALVEKFELIFERRPESIDVQRYYNVTKELKEVLDKTEPVYNV
ncbi:MAG: hypothetical protein LBE34_14265 [Flavobacteriaceae bacterium]|jgi:hypothetical protein|nr:hypothetical protein [Flavobacteriaceae bacterium]